MRQPASSADAGRSEALILLRPLGLTIRTLKGRPTVIIKPALGKPHVICSDSYVGAARQAVEHAALIGFTARTPHHSS